jgi:hypothetical protein
VQACTIIAKNYVAQARVLARSFLEHHPDGRFWVLIIDEHVGFIEPGDERFEVLTPAAIGCEQFEEMAFRYSVLELSTAVKPWLLRHLMAITGGPITYLDPDIKVYGSLTELEELAASHGLVLIPHNEEPIPDDGQRPSQVDIMLTGVYNLGHLSLAPTAEVRRLVDWWADRLLEDCRIDLAHGFFVDQRWFDLAPGLLSDLAIVRAPQYNVAYWNLHSRRLEHDGARYSVNRRPLAFFHFSGFDPLKPAELSIFQDRVSLSDDPVLDRICREYTEDTLGEGLVAARTWPYTFGMLGNDVPLDDTLRRLFRVAEERGDVDGSPFDRHAAETFVDWVTAQQPDAPRGVTRLLANVYGTRPDLQATFPDLSGPDFERFLAWAKGPGSREVPALGNVPLPAAADRAIAPSRSPWRLNGSSVRRRLRRAAARARRPFAV